MYGSTMFFVGVSERPVIAPQLWSTAGNHPGQHTLAAGMATAGGITAWFRELTGLESFERLIAEAEAAGPGAHGLLALPYFAGERTPIADPLARGVIAGLTLRHTRGDIYRALLEATAFGVRHNLEAFSAAGYTPRRIVAVGGGTTSALWPQIVSDVTGAAQEIPRETCGASLGDAKFAAIAIGAATPTDRWNAAASVTEPDPARRALLSERYLLYGELRRATSAIQHELARAQ
jgi:xylulokinase